MIKFDRDNTRDIIQMSLQVAMVVLARMTLGVFGESMVKQFKFFIEEQRNKLHKRNG